MPVVPRLTQCSGAHLAVLLGNTDLRVYRIQRDEWLQRHMFEATHRFWVEHVIAKPPPLARTRDEAEALHPSHEDGLTLEAEEATAETIGRHAQLVAQIGELEAQVQEVKDHVAATMGAAERLTWRGQTLATWRLDRKTTQLDLDRLRRERPDIAADYTVKGRGARRLQVGTGQADRTGAGKGTWT